MSHPSDSAAPLQRTVSGSQTSHDLLALQRTVGNRALQRLVSAPDVSPARSRPAAAIQRQAGQNGTTGDGKTNADPQKPADHVIGLDVSGKMRILGAMGLTQPLPAPKSSAQLDTVLDIYLYAPGPAAPDTVWFPTWQEFAHLQIKPDLKTPTGNVYNYHDVVQQLNRLSLARDTLTGILQELRQIPEVQAHFLSTADDAFVRDAGIERIMSGLPDVVKGGALGIGGGVDDRYEFMHFMRAYLGPDPATENHFKAIRKANIPGEVYLHEMAAQRIEAVAQKLEGNMPASWVGFGMRGRFRVHNRESNSRMAHPMGYAVDYRPYENPMIVDDRLVEFLEVQTGGATHFDAGNLGVNRSQRRALIQQMPNGEADPQAAQKFFENFEKEYNRIAQASTSFKDSLTAEVKAELLTMRDRFLELQTKIPALDRQIKSAKEDKKTALIEEKQTYENELTAMKTRLSTLLKPWLDKIAGQKCLLEEKVPNLAQIPSSRKELDTRLQAARTELRARQRAVSQLSKKKAPEPQALESANAEASAAEAKFKELEQMSKDFSHRVRWDLLTRVETSLQNDLPFVFSKNVRDPGVVQLVEKGFFTPDAEPGPGEKFNPNKHGFNLAFMRVMAEHGFDQGISWSPGSVDPMHFELVEGVDGLPDAATTKGRLDEARPKVRRARQ